MEAYLAGVKSMGEDLISAKDFLQVYKRNSNDLQVVIVLPILKFCKYLIENFTSNEKIFPKLASRKKTIFQIHGSKIFYIKWTRDQFRLGERRFGVKTNYQF